MATITLELAKGRERERRVRYRVQHCGRQRRIPSSIVLEAGEYTPAGRIKDHFKEEMAERLLRKYRERLYELEVAYFGNHLDIDTLVDKLKQQRGYELDFFTYADKWLARCTAKGKKNYITAINSLERFVGRRKLRFDDMTYDFLTRYEHSLKNKPRAASMYLACFKHIYREAMREYNDGSDTLIKRNPFDRYTPPRQQQRGQRAISLDDLLKIWNYNNDAQPNGRAMLARDCFIFSFLTMGTNSADLYDRDIKIRGDVLCYHRKKTRGRRADEAYIEVKLHPAAMWFVKKYKGAGRQFCFYSRYANEAGFNIALNTGLKEVGAACGIKNLQFYQARHTMASIARNECKTEKYLVNEMLNHVDAEMRVTDLYIKKDFTLMNEANQKMIDYVLSKKG